MNRIVSFLGRKPESDADIIRYMTSNNIRLLNFRYVAGDGRLKTLNFIIPDRERLSNVLKYGERVDGSSLFKSIKSACSDLFVYPVIETAFHNPFKDAVEILCNFKTRDKTKFDSSPRSVVERAQSVIRKKTGYELKAFAELEYYIICKDDAIYKNDPQSGYHESSPFVRWEEFRIEAMRMIAGIGGKIKYGHSEVGSIRMGDFMMEQQEIEFLPTDLVNAADIVEVSKWILRKLGEKYGCIVSFAPKLVEGHAGNGLHIHLKLEKKGEPMDEDTMKRAIGGILMHARSLTAFGNSIPLSYSRLVPHQEAPTLVCWGDCNRNAMVRVPLYHDLSQRTFEFRVPDGSAKLHYLLAGLCAAVQHGLISEDSLDFADRMNVDNECTFMNLPRNCQESAEELLADRDVYEQERIFSSDLINWIADELRQKTGNNPNLYLHC